MGPNLRRRILRCIQLSVALKKLLCTKPASAARLRTYAHTPVSGMVSCVLGRGVLLLFVKRLKDRCEEAGHRNSLNRPPAVKMKT